jgi:hypothetical protein
MLYPLGRHWYNGFRTVSAELWARIAGSDDVVFSAWIGHIDNVTVNSGDDSVVVLSFSRSYCGFSLCSFAAGAHGVMVSTIPIA